MRPFSKGFLAGILALLVVLGASLAYAVTTAQIQVVYLPLRYFVDGTEKIPPEDQKGFIYNGRTYVPLRFMADAMGQKVEYEASTSSIYIGRRPNNTVGVPVAFEKPFNQEWWWADGGGGSWKMEKDSSKNVFEQQMPNALLVTASCASKWNQCHDQETITLVQDHLLNGWYEKLSGTLFVPSYYLGNAGNRRVGRITVLDGDGNTLYESPILYANGKEPNLPFSVDVKGVPRIRIKIAVYPLDFYHEFANPNYQAQIGVSDLRLY